MTDVSVVCFFFAPGQYPDWDRCPLHRLKGISALHTPPRSQPENNFSYEPEKQASPQVFQNLAFFLCYFFLSFKFELRPGFLYMKCRFTFPARLLQSYNNSTQSAGQGLQFVTTIIFFVITCFFPKQIAALSAADFGKKSL